MTYGTCTAQRPVAQMVLADSGDAYREFADTLRGEIDRLLPGQLQWETSLAQERRPRSQAPGIVVSVGRSAFASVLDSGTEIPGQSQIVAALLPRLAFDRELARASGKHAASAVVLDQPPSRQFALIRAALPQVRRVGILVGIDSRPLVPAFRAAAQEQEMILQVEDVSVRGIYAALQSLLEESDVILAVADPSVYSDETIASILTAGYRRRIPLLGFSPAYVKAGALLGIYSTPAQVGKATATLVRDIVSGAAPSIVAPTEYSIKINESVAKSLGLVLSEDDIRRRMRIFEKRR